MVRGFAKSKGWRRWGAGEGVAQVLSSVTRPMASPGQGPAVLAERMGQNRGWHGRGRVR